MMHKNSPQYNQGMKVAQTDIVNFGIDYAANFAIATKDWPLDWFATGYRTAVNLATERHAR